MNQLQKFEIFNPNKALTKKMIIVVLKHKTITELLVVPCMALALQSICIDEL